MLRKFQTLLLLGGLTAPLVVNAQSDQHYIPKLENEYISTMTVQKLDPLTIKKPKKVKKKVKEQDSVETEQPKLQAPEERTTTDASLNKGHGVDPTKSNKETEIPQAVDVISDEEFLSNTSTNLKAIEESIHQREGKRQANPNASIPEQFEHPDLAMEEDYSDFDVIDITRDPNSQFDILKWDVETRTSAVKDWRLNPENKGLQDHVARFKEEVAAKYGITSFSLYRPGDPLDHGKGLAIDFMVPVGSDVGDQIASYALTQMYNGTERISYVIWEQHIWGDWSSGWKAMEDRGSITTNHYDHVHVSFHP